MPNGAEAAVEIQGYLEWWAWPKARGLSLTEPAVKFKRPWERVCVCVCGCFITVNRKDWVLSEMLSKDIIEASKIIETLNEVDRLVQGFKHIRTGKRVWRI